MGRAATASDDSTALRCPAPAALGKPSARQTTAGWRGLREKDRRQPAHMFDCGIGRVDGHAVQLDGMTVNGSVSRHHP